MYHRYTCMVINKNITNTVTNNKYKACIKRNNTLLGVDKIISVLNIYLKKYIKIQGTKMLMFDQNSNKFALANYHFNHYQKNIHRFVSVSEVLYVCKTLWYHLSSLKRDINASSCNLFIRLQY